jgi:hypothetical protein
MPPTAPAKSGPPQLEYMRAYQFVFDNPNWMMNVLLVAVCQLIPVIGGLLVLGYQFEVAEALQRRAGATYPDFDFNKFTQYLMRGLWPFLVVLVMSLVIAIPLTMLMFGGFFAMAAMGVQAGPDAAPAVMVVGVPLLMLGTMALAVLIHVFTLPMILRAGLMQDFAAAFDIRFAKDFASRVWKETIIAMLFLMVTSIPLALIGILACFVGVYAAQVLIVMAQAHLMFFQLYDLYLARGGEPIPLKPPPAAAPPVVRQ